MNSRIVSLAKPAFLLVCAGLLTHCGPSGLSTKSSNSTATTDSAASTSSSSAVSAAANNMKIQMTSLASSSVSSIQLNIARVDAVVVSNNQAAVVNLASNIGNVDLMNVQNGLSSTLADISLPAGVVVQQIDVVLASSGNVAISSNGSSCNLTVPGSLGNILPLAFGKGLSVASGSSYSLLLAMDARSAITSAGNGNCLFSPTLGLSAAYQMPASSAADIASGKMAVRSISASQVEGVAVDILGVVMPILAASSGAGSIISIVASVIEDLTGASSGSSGIGSIISTVIGDIFGSSSKAATTASALSVPINLATGEYLSGDSVGTIISTLLSGQGSNNTSIFGTLISDLTGGSSSSSSSSVFSKILGALDSPLTIDLLMLLL